MSDLNKIKKGLLGVLKRFQRQGVTLKSRMKLSSSAIKQLMEVVSSSLEDYVYLCDDRFHLHFINTKLKNNLSSTRTNKPCYSVLFNLNAQCSWCPLQQVLKGKQVRYEKRSPNNNQWYYVVNTPITLEGENRLFLAQWFDISRWKHKIETLEGNREVLESLLEERTGSLLAMNRMLKTEVAERREQEKELKFKDLALQSSVNAMIIADDKGLVTYVNNFFLMMWGFSNFQEIVGESIDSLWEFPEDIQSLVTIIKKNMSWLGEIRAKRANASGFDALVSIALVCDDSGGDAKILCTVVDITKRREVEKAIEENEERLLKLIHTMPIMMDAFGSSGEMLMWNRECERVTGYLAKEIINNPKVLEILYPDDFYRAHLLKLWSEKGNNFRNWEMTLTAKDGSERIISWSNISESSPIKGWQSWAVGIDVTDKRRLEQQIVEAGERECERISKELDYGMGLIFDELESLASSMRRLHEVRAINDGGLTDRFESLIVEMRSRLSSIPKGLQSIQFVREDFVSAIKKLCADIEEHYKVVCAAESTGDFLIKSESIAVNLYNIIREAMRSAITHGLAKRISISMQQDRTSYMVLIDDDGNLSKENSIGRDMLGTDIMKYWAGIMGVKLLFEQSDLGGLRIIVQL